MTDWAEEGGSELCGIVMRIVERRRGDCQQEMALGVKYKNLNSVDMFKRDQIMQDGKAWSDSCDQKWSVSAHLACWVPIF